MSSTDSGLKQSHSKIHSHDLCDVDENCGFVIEEHEAVFVASISFEESIGYEIAEAKTQIFLEETSREVQSCGGIVGHMKAAVKGEEKVTTFSTTGGNVNVSKGVDRSAQIDIAILVLNIQRKTLETVLAGGLKKIRSK